MKKLSVYLLALTALISTNVFADTIDDQVNSANNFVVIGTPTYQGSRFLGNTADEDGNGVANEKALLRATQICSLMKLGKPVAYSASYNADQAHASGQQVVLWSIDQQGDLVLNSYNDGAYDGPRLEGRSSFISSLTCTKL